MKSVTKMFIVKTIAAKKTGNSKYKLSALKRANNDINRLRTAYRIGIIERGRELVISTPYIQNKST